MKNSKNYVVGKVTSPDGFVFTGVAGRDRGFIHISLIERDDVSFFVEDDDEWKTYDDLPIDAKIAIDKDTFNEVTYQFDEMSGFSQLKDAEDAKKVEAKLKEIEENDGQIQFDGRVFGGEIYADIVQDNLHALCANKKSFFKAMKVLTHEATEIFGDRRVANDFGNCLIDEVELQLNGRNMSTIKSANEFGRIMAKSLTSFIAKMDESNLLVTLDDMYICVPKGGEVIETNTNN